MLSVYSEIIVRSSYNSLYFKRIDGPTFIYELLVGMLVSTTFLTAMVISGWPVLIVDKTEVLRKPPTRG